VADVVNATPPQVRVAVREIAPDDSDQDRLWQELAGQRIEVEEAVPEESEERTAPPVQDIWTDRPCERIQASEECVLTKCEVGEGTVGLRIEGEFGAGEHGGARLMEQLRAAVETGVQSVLLDLSGVTALRLDGAAPLVSCQVSLERVGGRLALVTPDAAIGRLLHVSGLTERIRCFDDMPSALAYLKTQ
jgi:anti-anti-sigma factor